MQFIRPSAERHGPVFPVQASIDPGSVGRIVTKIGRKAGVVVNRSTKLGVETVKHASCHDLRRSFGFRWSNLIDTFKLQELMRHSNIETTRKYYVGRDAQNTAANLWAARDRVNGTTERNTFDNKGPIEQPADNQETTQAPALQGLVSCTP